jgi:hypothetical protein
MEDAHQMFDIIPNRNEFSWSTIIEGYAKYGKKYRTARQLFDEISVINTFIFKRCKEKKNDNCFVRMFDEIMFLYSWLGIIKIALVVSEAILDSTGVIVGALEYLKEITVGALF